MKFKEDGIEAEIPLVLAKTITGFDRRTFCLAYLKKDQFHREVVDDIDSEDAKYMKREMDKFFEIEKKNRNIEEIGGSV